MLNADDRKLLELAAFTAGFSVRTDLTPESGVIVDGGVLWNPLEDGDAALKLAQAMGLEVDFHKSEVRRNKEDGAKVCVTFRDGDYKRAIVCATVAMSHTVPDDRVSAAELRSLGYLIPESIPDCATVPRSSLRFGKPTYSPCVESSYLCFALSLSFAEPFEWVNVSVVIDPADGAKQNG